PDPSATLVSHTMSIMRNGETVRSRREKNERREMLAYSFMEQAMPEHLAVASATEMSVANVEHERPRVLEALGIILAEEETVNVAQLKEAGPTIIPNFPVSLV